MHREQIETLISDVIDDRESIKQDEEEFINFIVSCAEARFYRYATAYSAPIDRKSLRGVLHDCLREALSDIYDEMDICERWYEAKRQKTKRPGRTALTDTQEG